MNVDWLNERAAPLSELSGSAAPRNRIHRDIILRPALTALVVARDPSLGRRLVQRCGGTCFAECTATLERAGVAQRDAVIVVADGASMRSASDAIAHARSRFPMAALILFLRRDAVSGAAIEEARQARVDYIAIEGIDDVAGRLSLACRRSQARVAMAEAVERVIATTTPPLCRLLRLAVERAADPMTVSEAARILGVHRKTLSIWCARSSIRVRPRTVLLWPRVLLAARMLEQGTPSIESIALELGFPSGSALSATMRRLVGRSPSAILEQGAFATVRDAFYAFTPLAGR